MKSFLLPATMSILAAALTLSGCDGADSSGEKAATGGGSWDWLSWLVGSVGAVVAAFFGVRATLKTLRHSQYETAAKMIQTGNPQS